MKKISALLIASMIVAMVALMSTPIQAINEGEAKTVIIDKKVYRITSKIYFRGEMSSQSVVKIGSVYTGYGESWGQAPPCKVNVAIDDAAHIWTFHWDCPLWTWEATLGPGHFICLHWEVLDGKGFHKDSGVEPVGERIGEVTLSYFNHNCWTRTHVTVEYSWALGVYFRDIDVYVYVGTPYYPLPGGGGSWSKWYGPFLV